MDVARLTVRIDADTRDAEQGMDRVSQRLESVGRDAAMAGLKLSAGITAPLTLLGKGALDAAMDYEQGLNLLQAVSGASAEQMAAVAQQAKALGADLALPATSAGDATRAMVELAKAGLSVEDVLGASRGVMQLAAAGGLGAAQSAEIAANALNAFGLKGEQASRIADLFAAAANSSSVEVKDIADAFKMASAVFSAFQGPVVGAENAVVDLTNAIAILGNAGVRGSDAGTSLKQLMLQLTGPSNAAKRLMRELARSIGESGDIAFRADGSMRPLMETIKLMARATAGMTDEQRNYAVTQIFGADASRSALILMRAQSDEMQALGKDWDSMREQLTQAGAAEELAGARMKGLGGALEGLKSQLETVGLTVAEPFLGPLAAGVRGVAELVGHITDLPAPLLNAAIAFGAVMAAAGPLLLLAGGLATVLGLLLSPLGLVTLGIAGLAAAFAGDFLGIRSAVMPVLEELQRGFAAFGQMVANFQEGEGLGAFDAILQALAVRIGETFGDAAQARFEAFTQALGDGFAAIGGLVQQIGDGLGQFGAMVANFQSGEGLSLVDATLQALAVTIGQVFGPEMQARFEAFTQLVGDSFAFVQNTITAVLGEVVPFIQRQFQIVLDWVDANLPLMQQTFATVSSRVSEVLQGLGDAIQTILAFLQPYWENAWATMSAVVREVWAALQIIVETSLRNLLDLITILMQLINGDWEGAWDTFQGILQRSWDAVGAVLQEGLAMVATLLAGLLTNLGQLASDVGGKATEIGRNIVEGLKNGLLAGIDAVKHSAGELGEGALGILKKVLDIQSPSGRAASEVGAPFAQGMALGMLQGAGFVTDAAEQLAADAAGAAAARAGMTVGTLVGASLVPGTAASDTGAAPAAAPGRTQRSPWDSIKLAMSEVGRDSSFAERFGNIGSQAVANLLSFLETGDKQIPAKIGNSVQRMIEAARKVGVSGLDTLQAEIRSTLQRIVEGGETDLTGHFQDLIGQLFAGTEAGKEQSALAKERDKLLEGVAKVGQSAVDKFRLQLSPEQGGGIANVFLERVAAAFHGDSDAASSVQRFAQEILERITQGVSPEKAVHIADQFTAALSEALRTGDTAGLAAYLAEFRRQLAQAQQAATKLTPNFGVAQALSGWEDYAKSIARPPAAMAQAALPGGWSGLQRATVTIGSQPIPHAGSFGLVTAGGAPVAPIVPPPLAPVLPSPTGSQDTTIRLHPADLAALGQQLQQAMAQQPPINVNVDGMRSVERTFNRDANHAAVNGRAGA